MALFNKLLKKKNKKVVNKAGGEAYQQTPEMQLASMLLTSFASEQFYRSGQQTFVALKALIAKCNPEFVAKAGIYARTEFGMRSITHVLAAELAPHASGQAWAKSFYNKIVFRPDDMLEIIAYYYNNGGKTLPNAMKKGFSKSFDRFDTYQLAKYRGEKRTVKLVDAVNLVHPKPTKRNQKGLNDLMAGTLRSTGTWETKLTKAGQNTRTKEEKVANKKAAWTELIRTRKIGYFALLRNLRNILEQAPEMVEEACVMLTNPKWIRSPKNLVLPFRYLVAYKQFKNASTPKSRLIRHALEKAIDIACANVPNLANTLVVVDNSGSMTSPVAGSEHLYCSELGAIFGMMLAKRSNADLMEFGTTARYIPYDINESVMKFGANFANSNKVGHGTDFKAIFNTANRAYERVVIFSDMQGWIGYYAPGQAFKNYCDRTGANPYIYCFDLRGYGSLQFPENKVFQLAGFSEKVFDLMKVLETDRNALVNAIEAVEL